ncbi:ankyrin repeat-containing protein [Senna tora]|uniref:Ankyrin repeat-containing protein n=1 Tax=Senna tora TaxID=362788 RepID=A0A834XDT1_9FABA|nr:ankyrin repeat-containing protein [Senna tora]
MSVLYEASYRGCVSTLNDLIHQNPLILYKISKTTSFETPLHISTSLGHLDFTKALLTNNPKLALELDASRSTPLHVASAEGHIEIVVELLKLYNQVCLFIDDEGRIPLHYAAMRGRIEVARELIKAKPESLSFLDNGKTVFHLCVTYNHLETLKAFVELEIEITGKLLNFTTSDDYGNTILHLAIVLKQVESIRYLLSFSEMREAGSMKNHMGFTAHEIMERSPKDFKILEIQLMLMNAGITKTDQKQGRDDILDHPHPPAVPSSRKRNCCIRIFKCIGNWFKHKDNCSEFTAVIMELQKTQALLEKRCSANDDRLLNVEELLAFDGTDAEYWVFKVKEFFRIAGTPENQRIGLSALYMTGPASAWYMWMTQNNQISTWSAFLESLLFRFSSTLYDDARGALKQVVQVSTLDEYQAAFETISTKVTGLSEEWLISFFVFGLKTHLRCEVLLAQPTTYYQAVSLAKLSFSKLLPNAGSMVNKSILPVTGSKIVTVQSASNVVKQASSQGSNNITQNNTPAYKRFTAAELKERRALGLCYYCPEKYVRGHKCTPTYYLLIGKEELDLLMEDETEETTNENPGVEAVPEVLEAVPEISFNALEGQFHPRNEAFLVCNHQCKQIKFMIHQNVFVVDLFVMDIKGADVVLGVQWLAELGNIVINRKELTMIFQLHGQEVKLQGDSILRETPIN